MKQRAHVAALCGSLGDDSGTRIALERALAAVEDAGGTTELIDLRWLDLPAFDADEPIAGDAPELSRRLRAADGVLLGTPVYHGSYSSPLKTALDYVGFGEFDGTTVGLLAVAGGRFPTPALEHLRSVARALNAWTVPHQVGIPNSRAAFEDGAIVDDDLATRVETLGETVFEYAGVEEYPSVAPTTRATTEG